MVACDETPNSPQNDWFPALSNDECTLLFASDRPGGEGGLDLWMCQRSNATAAWSNPKNLGPTINTPQNDQMPRLAADGLTLLCVRVGAGQDIVMHTRATPKGPWSKAIHLDSKINSTAPDWTPFLSADFRTLLLSSQRPGGHGFRDLWVSRRVKRQTNE